LIDHAAFIRANTSVLTPPLVPEVTLHLAHEAVPLWQKTEEELGEMGLPPPFWAFAWAGGQALARYVLDNPEIVRGKRVLDLASGSGLVAIAAMKAGAASVLAADIDLFAVAAIGLNSALNSIDCHELHPSPPRTRGRGQGEGVVAAPELPDVARAERPPHPSPLPHIRGGEGTIVATSANLLDGPAMDLDVILVGDLFYDKAIAGRCFDWLTTAQSSVLIGDPGRTYLPRDRLINIIEYAVPVTRDLEDAEIKHSAVWRLARCC
jgi:predicted nicotinamide N-methyase